MRDLFVNTLSKSMASALIVGLRHMRHGGAARTAPLLCLQQQHINASVQLLPSALRITRAFSSLPMVHRSPLLLQRTAPNALGVLMDFQQRFSFSSSSSDDRKRSSISAEIPSQPLTIPTLSALDKERETTTTAAAPDAFKLEKDTWAERHCPEWMVPYIQLSRVNRPAGTAPLYTYV